jgi:hypothetical protein
MSPSSNIYLEPLETPNRYFKRFIHIKILLLQNTLYAKKIMCIAIVTTAHPNYPLIILNNRDVRI